MNRTRDLLISLGGWFLPRRALQGLAGKIDFAFIFHPRDEKDIARKFPFVARMPDHLVAQVFDHLWPIPLAPVTFTKADGIILKGWQIAVPSTAAALLRDKNRARRKILSAVRLAERMGAKLVGLGALTAILTDQGQFLASAGLSCKITTGHSLTVATVIAAAKKAAEIQGVFFQQATIAIVGAYGSIGSACAWWLAEEEVDRLLLHGLRRRALEDLKSQLSHLSRSRIEISTDLASLKKADVVIVVTNDPRLIIKDHHLKDGCVVIDGAQPPNVSPAVLNGKKILLAWGGLVHAPSLDTHFDLGLRDRHTVFSCLAECVVLGASDINNSPTVEPVELDQAKHFFSLASDLGFSLAPLQAFGELAETRE